MRPPPPTFQLPPLLPVRNTQPLELLAVQEPSPVVTHQTSCLHASSVKLLRHGPPICGLAAVIATRDLPVRMRALRPGRFPDKYTASSMASVISPAFW